MIGLVRPRKGLLSLPVVIFVAATVLILAWPQQMPGEPPRLKPTNLDTLNTPGDEDDPYLSPDYLRLYYTSTAPGQPTLFVARRLGDTKPWLAGQQLTGPNNQGEPRSPCVPGTGHVLYFAARIPFRDDSGGPHQPANYDLYTANKLGQLQEYTAGTPLIGLSTADDETHPWLGRDGRELIFSRKTKDGWRLFVATRAQARGPFGVPKLIEELPPDFHRATISRDGRQMYLQGPLPDRRWGLFRARRAGPKARWSKPEPLDALNDPQAPTGDTSPCLAEDGRWLFFSSDRPGERSKGGRDLWAIEIAQLLRVQKNPD